MAKESSFDVVSEIDLQEVRNAVDQAAREVAQRFDFKDTGASFELKEKELVISLKAPAEFQLKQMVDILTQRLGKRGIEARCMEKKDPVTNLVQVVDQVTLGCARLVEQRLVEVRERHAVA